MSRRKNKNKGLNNNEIINNDLISITKEEYKKYEHFCRLKDKLNEGISSLEEAWQDHCRDLCEELQINYTATGSFIEEALVNLRNLIRSTCFFSNCENNKKKKHKIQLYGGIITKHIEKSIQTIVIPKKPIKYEIKLILIKSEIGISSLNLPLSETK